MDAISAIRLVMRQEALLATARLSRLPKAVVNGAGEQVLQADTYTPSSQTPALPSYAYKRDGSGGT